MAHGGVAVDSIPEHPQTKNKSMKTSTFVSGKTNEDYGNATSKDMQKIIIIDILFFTMGSDIYIMLCMGRRVTMAQEHTQAQQAQQAPWICIESKRA